MIDETLRNRNATDFYAHRPRGHVMPRLRVEMSDTIVTGPGPDGDHRVDARTGVFAEMMAINDDLAIAPEALGTKLDMYEAAE